MIYHKYTEQLGSIRCNWFMESAGEGNHTPGLCAYLNTSCKGHLYCGQEHGPSACRTKGYKEYKEYAE